MLSAQWMSTYCSNRLPTGGQMGKRWPNAQSLQRVSHGRSAEAVKWALHLPTIFNITGPLHHCTAMAWHLQCPFLVQLAIIHWHWFFTASTNNLYFPKVSVLFSLNLRIHYSNDMGFRLFKVTMEKNIVLLDWHGFNWTLTKTYLLFLYKPQVWHWVTSTHMWIAIHLNTLIKKLSYR